MWDFSSTARSQTYNPCVGRLNLNYGPPGKPLLDLLRLNETLLPSSPFIVLKHGWSIFSFIYFHMGAWNASFSPYALSLFYLVMEERRGYIWNIFPSFQIHLLYKALVYFVIQSEYIHFLGVFLHCLASSLLYCNYYYHLVCVSLLAQVYILFTTIQMWHSVLGTHLLFRIMQPLDCWTEFSFCALSWNILWIIRSPQFSGTVSQAMIPVRNESLTFIIS